LPPCSVECAVARSSTSDASILHQSIEIAGREGTCSHGVGRPSLSQLIILSLTRAPPPLASMASIPPVSNWLRPTDQPGGSSPSDCDGGLVGSDRRELILPNHHDASSGVWRAGPRLAQPPVFMARSGPCRAARCGCGHPASSATKAISGDYEQGVAGSDDLLETTASAFARFDSLNLAVKKITQARFAPWGEPKYPR
jgi:hypothetical protein